MTSRWRRFCQRELGSRDRVTSSWLIWSADLNSDLTNSTSSSTFVSSPDPGERGDNHAVVLSFSSINYLALLTWCCEFLKQSFIVTCRLHVLCFITKKFCYITRNNLNLAISFNDILCNVNKWLSIVNLATLCLMLLSKFMSIILLWWSITPNNYPTYHLGYKVFLKTLHKYICHVPEVGLPVVGRCSVCGS